MGYPIFIGILNPSSHSFWLKSFHLNVTQICNVFESHNLEGQQKEVGDLATLPGEEADGGTDEAPFLSIYRVKKRQKCSQGPICVLIHKDVERRSNSFTQPKKK